MNTYSITRPATATLADDQKRLTAIQADVARLAASKKLSAQLAHQGFATVAMKGTL